MSDIVGFMPYVWLGVMVLCIIIEACTLALTTVWGAISALLMVPVSLTKIPVLPQVILFLLLTILLLAFTRPLALKRLHVGEEKTNIEALIGEEVLVTRDILPFKKGEVRCKNSVLWSASSCDDFPIKSGTICVVLAIQGNTLVVSTKK